MLFHAILQIHILSSDFAVRTLHETQLGLGPTGRQQPRSELLLRRWRGLATGATAPTSGRAHAREQHLDALRRGLAEEVVPRARAGKEAARRLALAHA